MSSTPDAPTSTSSRSDEPFPDHHNDLAATLKFAWQMVGRGVQDRRSAFHTPVLATQSAVGPQARVLVLQAAGNALTITAAQGNLALVQGQTFTRATAATCN